MRNVNFKELEPHSKSRIIEKIGEDNFTRLQKQSFIQKDEDTYHFRYVGVIIISDIVINCYPKYFPDWDEHAFKQIMRVVRKYKNTHEDMDYQNDSIEDISFNLLSMMIFFLEDYFKHGVYTNVENILEVNGSGEVDWNRTVNNTHPIISDNRPYYIELQTRYKVNDLFDYFRLLHECIITDASKRLEKAGLLELFDLTCADISTKKLDDFGEKETVLRKLEKELNVEFVSQKRKLLKAMHTYIEEVNSFSNENYLTIYGTATYHTVWEDICRTVFSDKLNRPLKILGFSSDIKLIDIIKKPEWVLNTGKVYKTDTFRPDLVAVEGDNFIILDAKYYNLRFDENSPKNHPGLADITKQYLYELAFRDYISANNFSVKNALLFPKYTGRIEKIGHVKIDILQELDLQNIQVVMLPADLANRHYLENRKIDNLCEYLTEDKNERVKDGTG